MPAFYAKDYVKDTTCSWAMARRSIQKKSFSLSAHSATREKQKDILYPNILCPNQLLKHYKHQSLPTTLLGIYERPLLIKLSTIKVHR